MPKGKSRYYVVDYAKLSEALSIMGSFEDTDAATRALRENGEDGHTYAVISMRGNPVTIKDETVTKRRLTAAVPFDAEQREVRQ